MLFWRVLRLRYKSMISRKPVSLSEQTHTCALIRHETRMDSSIGFHVKCKCNCFVSQHEADGKYRLRTAYLTSTGRCSGQRPTWHNIARAQVNRSLSSMHCRKKCAHICNSLMFGCWQRAHSEGNICVSARAGHQRQVLI